MANAAFRLSTIIGKTDVRLLKCLSHRNAFSVNGAQRRYGSALFISGRKANEVYSFLSPYLDYDRRFADVDKLQKELSLRGSTVDAGEVKKIWDFYKNMDKDKDVLEERRMEIATRIKELLSKEDKTPEDELEITKLKTLGKVMRDDLKVVKDAMWDLEENAILQALKLPNELDEKTPPKDAIVLNRVGTPHQPPANDIKSHIEIGKSLGLVEYDNPTHCYLCNDAALFELGALGLAGRIFTENDAIRIAGTDFSRSIVVEGCGLDHEDPADAFILDDPEEVERNSPSRMHLVGGASLISFLAMHSKRLINPLHLPLRYFATGRQYTPFPEGSPPIGLFAVCQASVAQAFVIVKDRESEEHEAQFEKLLASVTKLYDEIAKHYQIVLRPAKDLRAWESLRVSFEMWSPFAKQYVEVGHISVSGDYFSKRLLITYQTSTGRNYPSVISGTVLSVPRLLGCLLEENPKEFVIPPAIAKHAPID